jgi:hypothetical protein
LLPLCFFSLFLFFLGKKKKQKKPRLSKEKAKNFCCWPEEKELALSFIRVQAPNGSNSFFFQIQAINKNFYALFFRRPIHK